MFDKMQDEQIRERITIGPIKLDEKQFYDIDTHLFDSWTKNKDGSTILSK